MQLININGLEIRFSNGTLTIEGLDQKGFSNKDKIVESDKEIDGDVEGNLFIRGEGITVIINGDVEGNIIGKANITVKGNVEGNIVGGKISRM